MLRFILSRRPINNTAEEEITGDDIVNNVVLSNDNATANTTQHSLFETPIGGKRPLEDSSNLPATKIARFQLETESTENDWVLPDQLVDYVHRYMNLKIPDKEIKDKILSTNPVPKNVKPVPELDSYIKELLVDNNKTQTLHIEKLLKAIQERDRNIFGPLSKIWDLTEAEREVLDLTDEHAVASFKGVAELFEQSITLIAQSFHRTTYQRRWNILSTLIEGNTKVTDLLKDHADLLNDNENGLLFGEKFEEILLKSSKAKRKSTEVFTGLKKTAGAGHSSSGGGKQPFRQAPLPFSRGQRGNGRGLFFSKFGQKGKPVISSQPQMCESTVTSGLPKCSPISEGLVCYQTGSSFSTSVRQTKNFSKELGMSHTGSSNTKLCSRISNSICLHPNTTISSSNKFQQRGSWADRYRSFGDASERSYQRGTEFQKSDSKSHIPCFKEGYGLQTSYKSKESKFEYSVQALQNGRPFSSKGYSATTGSNVQTRSEGCLFLSASSCRIPEICSISVGSESISVPLPMFRTGSCSKSFYKTFKNPNCNSETTECAVDYIPRRHSFDGVFGTGINSSQRHTDIPSAITRLPDKYKEVRIETNSVDSISRSRNRFQENDGKSSTRQGAKDKISMSGNTEKIDCETKGTCLSDRETLVFSHCNSPSSSSIPLITAKTDFRTRFREKLRIFSRTIGGHKVRDKLVDSESESEQWKNIDSNITPNDNINRCLKPGVGGLLSWSPIRRPMVSSREEISYQCSGTKGYSDCNSNLLKNVPGCEGNTHSNRQYGCSNIFDQNGGHKESGPYSIKQRNMGTFDNYGDHNYCRTLTREVKCRSRPSIKVCEGFQRMEIMPRGVQTTMSETRNPLNRSICITSISSSSTVHVMEARSFQSRERRLSDKLDVSRGLCLSSFCVNPASFKKSSDRESNYVADNPSLANPAMVSKDSSDVHKKSFIDSKKKKSAIKSRSGSPSISRESNSTISGLEHFRERLSSEGLSEKTVSLISDSRRKGSIAHYNSAWRKFSRWCSKQQVDPFRCAINHILEFLTESFEEGLEHSTLAGYRSAISAYHEPINGVSVGKHPQVSALLAGVYNRRFPQPKYNFIWDVKMVIDYLNSLGENSNLSDKILTQKLSTLLALTSAARAHEIALLDIRFLVRHHSGYTFSFNKPTKVDRPGKKRPPLKFLPFLENKKLCVCSCIDSYLLRTSAWRGNNESQLLLSFVKPHGAVKSVTISRWLTDILSQSGIDVNVFSGHSTRTAASSKAKSCGVPIKEILSRGFWSKSTTFEKFYSREIVNENTDSFQRSILSCK